MIVQEEESSGITRNASGSVSTMSKRRAGESVVAGCERNAPRASFKNAAVNEVTMKELRTRVAARLDVLSCVISFELVVRHNDILRCGGGRCM